MKITAALLIVLALLIGIVPQFTDCEAQGRQLTLEGGRKISMKCHWTARAELGVALPILGSAGLMFASKRKESFRNLGLSSSLLGVTAILLPTSLIGVCGNPDMVCNAIMKPFLSLTGSVVVGLGLIAMVRSTMMKGDVVEKELASQEDQSL